MNAEEFENIVDAKRCSLMCECGVAVPDADMGATMLWVAEHQRHGGFTVKLGIFLDADVMPFIETIVGRVESERIETAPEMVPEIDSHGHEPQDGHLSMTEDGTCCLNCALACVAAQSAAECTLAAYSMRNDAGEVLVMQVVATAPAEIASLQKWHDENRLGEQ